MIDVNTPIRQAYFARLDGAVTLNGTAVPVYDTFADDNAVYPYIILSTQTDIAANSKQSQAHNATMLVNVVTGFTTEWSRIPVDTIAGQIITLINPLNTAQQITLGPSLQLISTTLVSDTTQESQDDSHKIIQRLITFGHIIHENVNA